MQTEYFSPQLSGLGPAGDEPLPRRVSACPQKNLSAIGQVPGAPSTTRSEARVTIRALRSDELAHVQNSVLKQNEGALVRLRARGPVAPRARVSTTCLPPTSPRTESSWPRGNRVTVPLKTDFCQINRPPRRRERTAAAVLTSSSAEVPDDPPPRAPLPARTPRRRSARGRSHHPHGVHAPGAANAARPHGPRAGGRPEGPNPACAWFSS